MNRTLCALVLGATTFLSLTSCGAPPEEAVMDNTVAVETTIAQTGQLSKAGTYIGTISAEGTANVVAMVSGTVEEVFVAVGDTVSLDTPLCRIDDESAVLSLESAQASYNSALEGYNSAQASYGGSDLSLLQEQLRQAQESYDAAVSLHELGSVSQSEVDQAYQSLISAQANLDSAKASLSSSQANIRSAQVAVETAEYQLSLYSLSSPISGVVEAVNVTENNYTSAGTTAFIISNGNNKTITFYVTDQVRQNLSLGQTVTATHGGTTYSGVITEISGVVDATTGQFKIKAIIEQAGDLPDGLSVELSTTAYQEDHAILVPSDALFFENGDAYVYVVQDGTAVRTPVTVGIYTTETSAITQGLDEGTEVVTTWSSSLRDGVSVRVSNQEEAEQGTPAADNEAGTAESSSAEPTAEGR